MSAAPSPPLMFPPRSPTLKQRASTTPGRSLEVSLTAQDESHGFLYVGGTFSTIDVPGELVTPAFGINNAGQIVGYFE